MLVRDATVEWRGAVGGGWCLKQGFKHISVNHNWLGIALDELGADVRIRKTRTCRRLCGFGPLTRYQYMTPTKIPPPRMLPMSDGIMLFQM